jgi:hypothetical protein
MPDIVAKIIYLAVALYVEAAIFPNAVTAMITSSFGTSATGTLLQPLFSQLVPLVAIVGTVLLFLRSVTE